MSEQKGTKRNKKKGQKEGTKEGAILWQSYEIVEGMSGNPKPYPYPNPNPNPKSLKSRIHSIESYVQNHKHAIINMISYHTRL